MPAIIANGAYGLTITTGAYTANEIYSSNSGYNVILDKVFDNDEGAYEAFGMSLWFANGAVMECASIYAARTSSPKTGVQYENGTDGVSQSNKYYLPDGSPV